MNENANANNHDLESEGLDPGEPISELAGLQIQTSSNFQSRLLRRIERRLLNTDLLESVRFCIREMFIEYWHLIMLIITGKENKSIGKD